DDEVQMVSEAIAELPSISVQQAETVLQEFESAASDPLRGGRRGAEYARRLLTSAFGVEGSQKHLERLPAIAGGTEAARQLKRLDPQTLSRFVRTEHPQTVAVILAHLNSGQSAAVLAAMDPAMRTDISVRIAQLGQVSPKLIGKILASVGDKLKSIGPIKHETSGGPRAVAEIFNEMDQGLSDEILGQIQENNSDLSDEIRQKMFVFDDLLNIDANGIKELLARADRRQLTISLKGTSDELRAHLLKGMSQRGAAMLLEDMEALGPVKIRDVEAAQQQMIAVVRQLESDGVISRKGGGGGGSDEQYI
ncbi:MAG TPA: flagellar motor switch protein FliG, partial [Bryobacteraceae bacterium]|nr:flagellar motor switch protein FliG [Bryobacteraceae bacterium]